MTGPLFEQLCAGKKFPFETLADGVEDTDEFWKWWWTERAEKGKISRPEIIQDDDPILEKTRSKPTVNLGQFPEFFDSQLDKVIKWHELPIADGLPRRAYQEIILRQVSLCSAQLRDRRQIIFAGGGYGSGKTTTLNYLAMHDAIPLRIGNLIGVDVFKQLIPEFNLIKAVGDGRASLTVQDECCDLSDELFDALVESERSFIWDSSMSRRESTMQKIHAAEAKGYELTLVAVMTPLQIAIERAMKRAEDSRRFPHPGALPESHVGFRKNFSEYAPLFDNIFVLDASGNGDCSVLAEKAGRTKQLDIYDKPLFGRALSEL